MSLEVIRMTESILTSIKKLLNLTEDYEYFDTDIMIHINSVFATLHQLGVGPTEPFKITSKEQVWSDFIQDNDKIESVKTYVYLKVRLLFDPPSGAAAEAFLQQANEYEWRLNAAADDWDQPIDEGGDEDEGTI